ncbi:MAG TPA: hypothetical protein VGE41_05270 [Verrucomicrobiae bacterium]|jgi:hypothetical protein
MRELSSINMDLNELLERNKGAMARAHEEIRRLKENLAHLKKARQDSNSNQGQEKNGQ